MNACSSLIDTLNSSENAQWTCREIDDSTVLVVSPRLYADGDNIELLVQSQESSLLLSDGGEILARLEDAGVNLTSGRAGQAFFGLIRSHGLEVDGGLISLRVTDPDQSDALLDLADALCHLDGIRLLAPQRRSVPFSDELMYFLESEFPRVERGPLRQGVSGGSYKLTAAAGSVDRLVLVQAVSGSTTQSRRVAVEHAFTAFSDVNGTVPKAEKLIVLGGDDWREEQVRLLSTTAYVGSWQFRDRVASFIWDESSAESSVLLQGNGQDTLWA